MEYVLIMNSYFIQYEVPLVEYVNVAQEINLFGQKWLVFCHFLIIFIIFEVQTSSAMVHVKIQLVCISLEVYTYFSPTII